MMQEAREVAVDVGKYLAFASTGRFSWTHLLERPTLRAFVTHLDSNGIGPEGMSMKTYGCVRVIFGRAYM
jgi:hypothetical protein